MIINGKTLLEMAPIRDMIPAKRTVNGISHGLTECGYDIRLKQEVIYRPCTSNMGPGVIIVDGKERIHDRFFLGSSIEYFDMPPMLMGRVLNKSTWAREGVDCSMATNIEPGWRGNLTIELIFNRAKEVRIPAGAGICQIIFERILNTAEYEGKYQDQEDKPVEARGLHFESKLYDNMAETLYMNPDQRNMYITSLWDTFSTEQQKTLLQNALCNHETIPDWMVVRQ